MKELQEVVRAWNAVRLDGEAAVLATVVRVDGSAYRRPGARMLIREDGQTVGSVSGGCLEADVVERAKRVLETGEPTVVTYDTTQDDDILFGVGLGCQGVVHLLIERLTPESDMAISLPESMLESRQAGVLATVYGTVGDPHLLIGDRLLLLEGGTEAGCGALLPEARRALERGHSASRTVTVVGGQAEGFFEHLPPPQSLVIFGAGQDAQPLTRLASELGWRITVADFRPAFATLQRFPQADSVIVLPHDGLSDALSLDSRTAAVVMTHNYLHDRALLAHLSPSPVSYLGVLGPRQRTQRLLRELREEGLSISDQSLDRLHSPIGLDIGAETPEQIALAIVAEIQARTAGRGGGFLRDTPGPIYPRTERDDTLPLCEDAVRPRCAVSA